MANDDLAMTVINDLS